MKIKTIVLLCLAISSSAFANDELHYIGINPTRDGFPGLAYYGETVSGCFRVDHADYPKENVTNIKVSYRLPQITHGYPVRNRFVCANKGYYPLCRSDYDGSSNLHSDEPYCYMGFMYTMYDSNYSPSTFIDSEFGISLTGYVASIGVTVHSKENDPVIYCKTQKNPADSPGYECLKQP